MSVAQPVIDLGYRRRTHVIAAIKGERRRLALGRLHPSFMGGEYLPDRRDTEVEIARINIDSTTSDVTSVYAKAGKDRIRYRVVDEYNGDTLSEKRTRSSKRPSSEVYPQFEAGIRARIDGWYAE
jgi:hypothetical protein